MAVHLVSFRIHDDATYHVRRASVVERIRAEADTGATFEEMTSLIVINSPKTASELGTAIYVYSQMASDRDSLLVTDVSRQAYAAFGHFVDRGRLDRVMRDQTLGALFGFGARK